jgi:lysophospholipase L1-like esterase
MNAAKKPFYRRTWFVVLAGLLILLLIAYKTLPQYYSYKALDATFFEDEIAAFEEADRLNPPEPGKVLFIGSSSIRFWDTLEQDMEGIPTIRRGFGGSFLRHSTHFADRIVTPYQPSAIVMYAGGNDMGNLHSPLSAEQVAADFDAFVAKVSKDVGDIPIIYIAIKPSVLRVKHWPDMQRANAMIAAKAAGDDRLYFVDIATPMLDEHGKPRADLLIWDGLHLNAEGYALWTKLVRPVVIQALEANSQA